MFVINIVAVDVCVFYAIIQFFSRTPKCPGSYSWGYAYPRLEITVLYDYLHTKFGTVLRLYCDEG